MTVGGPGPEGEVGAAEPPGVPPNGGPVRPDAEPTQTAGEPGVEPARAGSEGGEVEEGRRHPWRIAAVVFILIGVAVIVGGYLWVSSEASPSGPPGPQVIVTVGAGAGVNQLASTLESKGVIGSSLAYRIWGQFHGLPGVLAGSYAFNKNISFAAVNRVVSNGPNVFPMEVPPGFTVAEVAHRVGQLPGPLGRLLQLPGHRGNRPFTVAARRLDQSRGPARHG